MSVLLTPMILVLTNASPTSSTKGSTASACTSSTTATCSRRGRSYFLCVHIGEDNMVIAKGRSFYVCRVNYFKLFIYFFCYTKHRSPNHIRIPYVNICRFLFFY